MAKYQLYARIVPSILSSIPALLYQYFFLNQEIANFLQFLDSLKFIGDITISIVILYFISQTNRLIAKKLFEKKEIYLPTTNFLLFSNQEYSKEYKQKIYEKIQHTFDIRLPTKNEQEKNEMNSRKRIAEAMSLVRKRIGNGKLLLQHNIEYGFWRNLIGGTIFAIIFSGMDAYFAYIQSNASILVLSISLLIVYSIPLFLNKYIIQKVSALYARTLIQEYMAG